MSTRTLTHDEVAETTLERDVLDVTRVPVGQVVDVAPMVRTEGDTTIVPIVEERLVMVKQLYLKEELHIRHSVERETVQETVPLRSQYAVSNGSMPKAASSVRISRDQRRSDLAARRNPVCRSSR